MVRHLGGEQRRALELLAGAQRGLTEATLLRHGLAFAVLTGLVRNGLAAMAAETVTADGRTIEVVRVRITAAGWRALEGPTDTE